MIIEGETGVGKTALVEMLSKLWNQSLLNQWTRQKDQILDFIRHKLGDMTADETVDDFMVMHCVHIASRQCVRAHKKSQHWLYKPLHFVYICTCECIPVVCRCT